MLYALIIAGGAGKRLWPKSRKDNPKFLLKLKTKRSLLQETVSRLRQLIPLSNIIIATNKDHLRLIRKELPKLPKQNIITEPISKNTAPAICLGASLVKKRNPNGVMFVLPADGVIEDKAALKEVLALAFLIAHIREAIVTIGIKPVFAATGYGYIKAGRLYKRLTTDKRWDCYKVDKFIEKPSPNKAKQFFKAKNCFWNSGMFIGRAQTFLDEFKKHKPSVYRVAERIEKALATRRQQSVIDRHYKKFPNISIDYAIMEKTKKAYVVKADIPWQDIGSWASIDDYLNRNAEGNVLIGSHLVFDTKNSVILGRKDHLVATVGLDNIAIIHTAEATLVCSKEKAEDVKKLVELMEKKGLKKYL